LVGYYDFSKIKHISTAAAVVLAAEYERIAKLNREIPPTVDLDKWTDDVFRTLYQLGFFEIVGLSPQRPAVVTGNDTALTMQIVSMKNADDLADVDKALQRLGEFLNPARRIPDRVIIDLLTGLSEAISNVTNHAYSGDNSDPLPHIGSLWISATADRSENSLTVVVFDQGVTIPFTYPRIGRLEKVTRFLARALKTGVAHEYENDGTYIRAAMKFGGSSTDQKHRGRGLPQMIDVLNVTGAGRMTVYSRGGWCQRDASGRFTSGAVSYSIGGTLIEWTLELSKLQQVGEQ
jgi:anti-sigma regulatory factor (Ser/Thr protein kinase)